MSSEKEVYLYHYTTVQALAAILNSGNIRFKRLDLVNDPEECEIKIEGFEHIKRLIYVSSWTDNVEETLPMWKMYTNNYEGVRIGLPINMFDHETYERTIRRDTEKGIIVSSIKRIKRKNIKRKCFAALQDFQDVQYIDNHKLLFEIPW